MNFAFAGEMVPGMGKNSNSLRMFSRYNGKEINFDGGDKGLHHRFWNPAENNYSESNYAASDIANSDAEILAEEAAFLGLENLFACRNQCKKDLGGAPSLRQCIRECKGKGLTRSAQKTKDLQIQEKMAESLAVSAASGATDDTSDTSSSNKTIWIVVGVVVALIIIGLLIYFLTRKKSVVPVTE